MDQLRNIIHELTIKCKKMLVKKIMKINEIKEKIK